jgi:hypothetical protein
LADGANLIAGGYIYLTEGDAGPLKSTFTATALGAVGGVAFKVFGGKSFSPFSGVRVNIAANKTGVEASKYAGSQAGEAIPAQICK